MPDINWGGDSSTAPFSSRLDEANGDLILAEDNSGSVVLLEWDGATWQYRGPVDMNGENISGVGTLTATDVTVSGTVDTNTVSTDTLVNRPDWVEDANSPFNLSGSPSVSGSLADTGFDQYLLLLEVDKADEMRTSGVTGISDYDTLFNDDSRTANAAEISFTVNRFGGAMLVETRLFSGRHELSFDIVQEYAQNGVPVAGANNAADDFTSFTFEDSGGGTVDATVEVFHR